MTKRHETEKSLPHGRYMKAVGLMSRIVAHDFNNILQIIQSNLEMISSGKISDSIAQELLDKALSASIRGSELTGQLLDFSRETAKNPKLINPQIYLKDIIDNLSTTHSESVNIRFEQCESDDFGKQGDNIFVNIEAFERVILNLIQNAKDSISIDGEIIISTSTQMMKVPEDKGTENSRFFEITIQDNGCGMPLSDVEQAFVPFFTTKKTQDRSGMGLSLVYGFCQQSQGFVNIESGLGIGTIVRMSFPCIEDRIFAENSEISQNDVNEPQLTEQTYDLRGLIVDDDDEVRQAILLLMMSLGIATQDVNSANAALEVLSEDQNFDFVFTDVFMPGSVSGIGLADECARSYPSIKVFLASGYPENELEKLGKNQGDYNLIRKPFSLEELEMALNNWFAACN